MITRWEWKITGTLAHWTSRTCMELCSFQGQRDLSEGPKLAWGSGCPGLCARPFSSTSGPRKTDRRKQQHPSPSPYSSSICTAELDGPARMWRILLLKLFLVFICCVRWCHSEGKSTLIYFSSTFIFLFTRLSAEWVIEELQSCAASDSPSALVAHQNKPVIAQGNWSWIVAELLL